MFNKILHFFTKIARISQKTTLFANLFCKDTKSKRNYKIAFCISLQKIIIFY
jgi:hypothetical protein